MIRLRRRVARGAAVIITENYIKKSVPLDGKPISR
jgi:hypothetical protein